jgi:hypothetical protein
MIGLGVVNSVTILIASIRPTLAGIVEAARPAPP